MRFYFGCSGYWMRWGLEEKLDHAKSKGGDAAEQYFLSSFKSRRLPLWVRLDYAPLLLLLRGSIDRFRSLIAEQTMGKSCKGLYAAAGPQSKTCSSSPTVCGIVP